MSILHWFNAEYWEASWPNIFSPNIWTLAGLALHLLATLTQRARHHREAEQRADERHEELKQHVTKAMGGSGD